MPAHTLGAALGCWLAASLLCCGEALAYQRPGDERFDYTAYTLRGGEVSLGPQKSAIGIVDEVTLGTYLPTWFAFPVLGAPIPTGFLKLRAPLQGKLALSVRGNFVYVDADVLAAKWTEIAVAARPCSFCRSRLRCRIAWRGVIAKASKRPTSPCSLAVIRRATLVFAVQPP